MKFRNIEFTLMPNGYISYSVEGGSKIYKEDDTEFTHAAIEWMKERYSKVLKKLEEEFKSSKSNTRLFRWKIVTKFFACKCGALDSIPDIDEDGNLNAEKFSCAYRAFCKCKDTGCEAMPDLKLTDIEKEIVYTLFEGNSTIKTAIILGRDIEAVNSSIGRACKRFGLTKNASKLVAYCNKHNLI